MQERFRLIVAKTKVIMAANQKEGKHRKDNPYGCLGEHTFVFARITVISKGLDQESICSLIFS